MSTREEIITELTTNVELRTNIKTVMNKDGIDPVLVVYGGSMATNLWVSDESDVDIYAFHTGGSHDLWSLNKTLQVIFFLFTPSKVRLSSENIDNVINDFLTNELNPERKVFRYETVLHFQPIYERADVESYRDQMRNMSNSDIGQMYLDAGDYQMLNFHLLPDKYGARALRMYLEGVRLARGLTFIQDMRDLCTWASVTVNWGDYGNNTIDWQPLIDSAKTALVGELS